MFQTLRCRPTKGPGEIRTQGTLPCKEGGVKWRTETRVGHISVQTTEKHLGCDGTGTVEVQSLADVGLGYLRLGQSARLRANLGGGVKAPHVDFPLAFARLRDVVVGLHPHERVHLHGESFLDA